jgi:hypothetical protein
LTEIYLCHACSYHGMLRMETGTAAATAEAAGAQPAAHSAASTVSCLRAFVLDGAAPACAERVLAAAARWAAAEPERRAAARAEMLRAHAINRHQVRRRRGRRWSQPAQLRPRARAERASRGSGGGDGGGVNDDAGVVEGAGAELLEEAGLGDAAEARLGSLELTVAEGQRRQDALVRGVGRQLMHALRLTTRPPDSQSSQPQQGVRQSDVRAEEEAGGREDAAVSARPPGADEPWGAMSWLATEADVPADRQNPPIAGQEPRAAAADRSSSLGALLQEFDAAAAIVVSDPGELSQTAHQSQLVRGALLDPAPAADSSEFWGGVEVSAVTAERRRLERSWQTLQPSLAAAAPALAATHDKPEEGAGVVTEVAGIINGQQAVLRTLALALKQTQAQLAAAGANAAEGEDPTELGAREEAVLGLGVDAFANKKAELSIEAQLEALYTKHNPAKLPDIPLLLTRWVGKEDALLAAVRQKYEPASTQRSEAPSEAGQGALVQVCMCLPWALVCGQTMCG